LFLFLLLDASTHPFSTHHAAIQTMHLCRQVTDRQHQADRRPDRHLDSPRWASGAKVPSETPKTRLFCSVLAKNCDQDTTSSSSCIRIQSVMSNPPRSCLTQAAAFTGRRLVVFIALTTLIFPPLLVPW
jgi:hypothetical protein